MLVEKDCAQRALVRTSVWLRNSMQHVAMLYAVKYTVTYAVTTLVSVTYLNFEHICVLLVDLLVHDLHDLADAARTAKRPTSKNNHMRRAQVSSGAQGCYHVNCFDE
jgi:hypothetical protein